MVKIYLKENEDKCRLLLGKFFVDILLIVNAQYNFSQRRDGNVRCWMLDSGEGGCGAWEFA